MNVIACMDRYWKEVLEVSTWKHGIKGLVSLRYAGCLLKVSTNLNIIFASKWDDSQTKNGKNKSLAKLSLASNLLSWSLCLSLEFAHQDCVKVHANF